MSNQEETQKPSHFFRVIMSPENARMKIPSNFLKAHGMTLSKDAFLKVGPVGKIWKLGVERSEGLVWLLEGWKEFAEYYSIKLFHILMFRYEGESKFDVSIYDPSTMEIPYPVRASSNNGVGLDPSQVVHTEEDEIDDDYDEEEEEEEEEHDEEDDEEEEDDDDYECPQRLPKNREKSRAKRSSEKRTRRATDAWTRAKAFKSSNPFFTVRMQPNYVNYKQCVLCIPNEHSRKHIIGKKNKGMVLVGEDEKRWFVNYGIYSLGKGIRQRQVRLLTSTWKDFVIENLLQVGDACVFELVNLVAMEYKVTIFRHADYAEEEEEGGDEGPSRQPRSSAIQSSNRRIRHSKRAREEVKRKAEAFSEFSCPNPSFTAIIRPYNLSRKKTLYVPQKHGKAYLLGKGDNRIYRRIGDKTWNVPYTIEGPHRRARLSSPLWGPFVRANRLEVGDTCVFEFVDGVKMVYEVTIFRIADCAA